MTQAVVQVRSVVDRSGFANPLTLPVLISDSSYLKVYADGELLTNGPDYSLTGIGDPEGVQIEIIGAEDPDEYLGVDVFVALYDPPLDQQGDLSAGGLLGRAFENALDQQNRRLQALNDKVGRSLHLAPNTEASGELPWPPGDGETPIYDANTETVIWGGPAGAAAASAAAAAASAVSAALAESDAEAAEAGAEAAAAAAAASAIDAATAAAGAANKLPLDGSAPMTGPIRFTHQASPSNPAAGLLSVFAKSDDRLYTRNSAGVEIALGSGDIIEVATRTALKALDTTKDTTALLTESGREGVFIWRSGNYSTQIAADTAEGLYLKADAIASSAGAWVRAGDWSVDGADASWFGYVADYNESTRTGTDNAAIITAALGVPGLPGLRFPSGKALIPSTVSIPIGKFCRGVPAAFPSFLGGVPRPSSIESGTVWISNTAGTMTSGRPTNEVVRQNRDTELRDVFLFWDNQPTPATSWTPSDTPWAVRAGRFTDNSRDVRAEHTRTIGVIAMGFTHAFEFQRGGEGGLIRDCKAHAFKIGFSLDGIHHIIQLDNVECFPYWTTQQDVTNYTIDNLIAFEIGRVDGLKVRGGLFSIYARIGVLFEGSRSPDFGGQPAFFFDIDAIYSDSCTHALMVGNSVTLTAVLTGHIGHLISNRTSGAASVLAANDYGVRLRGLCDISIGKFEGTGSGFTRPGGHVHASASGARLHIEYARVCPWDTGNGGHPAFSFTVAGTYLSVGRCDLNDGTNYFSTSKRVYGGVSASGEDNIATGQRLYIDGIGNTNVKAVTINSTDQTLLANYPVKLVAAGYREFRVRARVAAHPTLTNFTLKSGGNSGHITDTLALAIAAGNTDVDGSWKSINRTVANEAEFGSLLANGVPGDASLSFTRLGFEFR